MIPETSILIGIISNRPLSSVCWPFHDSMSKIDHFYSFGLHCVLPEVALGLLRKLHKNFLGANQEAHPLKGWRKVQQFGRVTTKLKIPSTLIMSKIDNFYLFGLHCVLPEVARGLLKKLHKNFLGADQGAHPLIIPGEGPKIWERASKVIYPKYFKHWPHTLTYTIVFCQRWPLVFWENCTKIFWGPTKKHICWKDGGRSKNLGGYQQQGVP